jgi:putative ABC transport system permease protein
VFHYHLRLAWLGMRRTPVITALMIAAVAVGIAVTTTSLTVHHLMSSNPIAHRDAMVYAVTMDSWDPREPADDRRPHLPPSQLTYRDAMAVLASDIPSRKAVMRKTAFTIEASRDVAPWVGEGRLTTADFFAMFDVPFRHGGAWDAQADRDGAPVVVLTKATNDKAFGGADSVGRTIRLDSREYRVVGVLDHWQPTPKFYDLNNGAFDDVEEAFIPFARGAMFEMQPAGNVNCWKPEELQGFADFLGSECIWYQAWVELRDPEQQRRFGQFLDGYVAQQKTLGRFPRPTNNRLDRPSEWLANAEVVTDDSRVLLGLSFAFLAVCVLNVVGLLLSKFLGAAPAIALRRALGASRGDLFRQHLVEVGVIGLAGGVLGLVLGWLALKGVQRLYENYDRLTQLDLPLVAAALGISLLAGVLAGLYPAWRVCRVQPATYLKTQ